MLRRPTTIKTTAPTLLRAIYVIIAVIVLGVIALWTEGMMLFSVTTNDHTVWRPAERGDSNVVIVTEVVPGGAADVAGVMKGDVVLQIGSRQVASLETPNETIWHAQAILNSAPTDRPVPYVVMRNGRILSLEIELEKIAPIIQTVYPIFGALWLLIGLTVVLSRPTGRVQILFFLTGLFSFFAFSAPVPAGILDSRETMMLWRLAAAAFFPAWLIFCATFPSELPLLRSRRRKVLVWLLPIAIAGLAIVAEIGDPVRGLIEFVNVSMLGLGVLYFTGGILLLFRGQSRLPEGPDRRPMRVILAGTVLSACVLIYVGLIIQGIGSGASAYLVTPAVLLPALPISFAWAIFRYELMDFRAVLRTAVVYAGTTALIAGVYFYIAFRLGDIVSPLFTSDFEIVVRVAIFAAMLLVFDPVRKAIQSAVERRFFPQYRDYSLQLEEYSRSLNETVTLHQVASLIEVTLRENLQLERVAVLAVRGESLLPIAGDPVEHLIEPAAVRRLFQIIDQTHRLFQIDPLRSPALADVQKEYPYQIGMVAGGRIVGVIMLGRRQDEQPISGSQITFVNGVAAQGASGLEASRLYDQELARQRVEEELATARRIQQSLLPSSMPTFEGVSISAVSHPAAAVGGDYYDVITLGPGKFLAIVADVSGKGVPASLYMAELHGMVRVVADLAPSAADMLSLLNRQLAAVVEKGTFITALLCLVDLDESRMEIVRAGHTPLIRIREGKLDRIVPRGLPLGIRSATLFDETLESQVVELRDGDRFVLYSDGVSEAMNREREEFGDDRLDRVLLSSVDEETDQVIGKLLDEVERFRSSAEQNDDVTLLTFEIGWEAGENGNAGVTLAEADSES